MENLTLSFISVVLFCLCCRQLLRNVTAPIPTMASSRRYARGAMVVGKAYKTLAWGTMTASFLAGLIFSFHQVFITL